MIFPEGFFLLLGLKYLGLSLIETDQLLAVSDRTLSHNIYIR